MRKSLALILALMMALTSILVGCGNDGGSGSSPSAGAGSALDAEASSTSGTDASMSVAASGNGTPALKEKYVIGFSEMYGTDSYIMCIQEGIEAQIAMWEEDLGVEIDLLVTDAGNEDPTRQQADLEDLYAQGVDGVIIFPGDSDLVISPIESLYNVNNVPVVITDCGVNGGELLSFIITDQYELGVASGEMLVEGMTEAGTVEKGKVVAINTHPANVSCLDRVQGFQDASEAAGCEVIETMIPSAATIDACYQSTEDLLTSTPDVTGIFTVNNIAAVGISMCLKDYGRDDIMLVANDGSAAMLALLEDGTYLYGTAMQQPYQYGVLAVDQLMYHFTGQTEKIEAEINPEPILCTKHNVSEYVDNPLFQY